jgi:Ca2+-binding RTX toxin-like protein
LNGGAGNDLLEGGEGKDTFVFTGAFGHDIITDFKPQNDTIKIEGALLANFAAVLSHATEQTGQYPMVIINLDANNSIALVGLSLADLSAKDFTFG